MPFTSSDMPELLSGGLKAVFFEALKAKKGSYGRIATVVESNSDTEHYPWLGANPAVKEFLDERAPASYSGYEYAIKNRTWEASVAVERAAIEDDKLGQIKIRVSQLADEARRHRERLVFETLAAGFTAKCHDGQPLFSASHPGDGGTQSNLGASALSYESLAAAVTGMMKIKDDRGNIAGIKPDVLVVPADLQWTAMELLESNYYPHEGTTTARVSANALKGKLDIIVSPYLTDTNNWFLLDTSRAVKPIILQSRTPVQFNALEGNSETGFMRDTYIYGIRARYNTGYGLWQCAYGSHVS